MTTLSVRLPEKISRQLEHLAQVTGRTKTYYVREAIIEHMEELEDVYIALHRLEKPGKRWALADLEKERDLAS